MNGTGITTTWISDTTRPNGLHDGIALAPRQHKPRQPTLITIFILFYFEDDDGRLYHYHYNTNISGNVNHEDGQFFFVTNYYF